MREEKGGISPQILHLMKSLDITQEQAEDIIECDKRIDKGEKLFELSQEERQVERAMKQTRSVDAYGKTRTREKKEDTDKKAIVSVVADALQGAFEVAELEVGNTERELTFKVNGRKFKIVLSAPRT